MKKLKYGAISLDTGGMKMALFVKSAVRSQLKGMRASEEFFKALDKDIAANLANAIQRAKNNGRKTCRGCDL